MDFLSKIQNKLNSMQFEATKNIKGATLIVAGAGSGKTRVITYRIAYMLSLGIHQKEILALTFTNKAASEMKERVKTLLAKPLYNLTISTFHSFGLLFLKENYKLLSYKKNFSIYDENDKLSLIKELAIEENLKQEPSYFKYISNLISLVKNELLSIESLEKDERYFYDIFEERLKLYNAFDFDDLISKPKLILEKNPHLREIYSKRFKYVLIDEFQDTSLMQYKLIRLLILHDNICCVGDDDQSIYSWRGANYQNMLNFELDYNVREIKLEQNYRSTNTILAAANALISNNSERKDKVLWTNLEGENKIDFFILSNETAEADFVANKIVKLSLLENFKNKNIGILFRTNSLFKHMELALRKQNIPYKISGGSSFFQKKEVKDVISYLNLLINPKSDYDLLRIINVPRRGIGREYLKKIRDLSDRKRVSLYDAMRDLVFSFNSQHNTHFNRHVMENIEEFVSFMEEYHYSLLEKKEPYYKVITNMLEELAYLPFLYNEHKDNKGLAEYKANNIRNFVEIIENWERKNNSEKKDLSSFLNYIVLQNNEDFQEDKNININLMTIHASKGLEFDVLFFCAVENDIIPHQKTVEEGNLEEERRLFYVALTRAKEEIYLTMARERGRDRQIVESMISPFIGEIPQDIINFKDVSLEPSNAD